MRVRNTKISQHRLGCRLPFECGNLDYNYATPGEVKTYYMSPEEIARRYGPPVKVEHKQYRRRLDKESLAEMLRDETAGIVARKNMIPKKQVLTLCEKYGLELDENGRLAEGVDDLARGDKLKAAKEKLPKAEFGEYIAQGLTNTEIAEKTNIELWLVKRLRQKYNLTGITGKRNRHTIKKEREAEDMAFEKYPAEQSEAASTPCEAEPEKVAEPGTAPEPVKRNIHDWIARRDELAATINQAQAELEKIDKMFSEVVCELVEV